MHERGDNPVDFLADVSARFSRIAPSPKPWVAVVHGYAVAGGLELALAWSSPTPPSSATVTSTGGWYRPADQASGSPVRSDADFGGDERVPFATG
ncbi:hypothetical protein [Streptomyces sasae]|uniref:hypothetical protein n=1 Tax=Streptomyces sasae TaxID=1266772 RepID=UPI00374324AC